MKILKEHTFFGQQSAISKLFKNNKKNGFFPQNFNSLCQK